MKKLLFLLPCLMLLLVGCDVHEFPTLEVPIIIPEPEPEPEKPRIEVVVNFDNLGWPDLTTVNAMPGSRAAGSTVYMLRYTLNVYEQSRGRSTSRSEVASQVVLTEVPYTLSDVSRHIAVELAEGTYSAIVWVDYVDARNPDSDLHYSVKDFDNITLAGDTHAGNTETREAFRGTASFSVLADGTVADAESREPVEYVPITVERPLARFEFITTDLEEYLARSRSENADAPALSPAPNPYDYTVRIRYTGYMPSVYNAHLNKPVDSTMGVSFAGKTEILSANEASLGFDHVFVNGSEASVQVALDIYNSDTGALISSSSTINVPLQRNRRTVVRGKFLTTTASGGVGINPEFNGDFNIEII
ncbi:MAG: hypothetical protein NC301_00850 [Bacteroides sp.]|nr:hypothetical protein [Bacteroides sp.]MCM1378840.1 hypothetical protein [Bacteroides sp.]MCM1445457.1 hypothetical protein [Prevotella sp.]